MPGVPEVAATVCGLLPLEDLAEHFKSQMSSRNRHKTVPQGVSGTGAWGFFRLRLILLPFIFEYAAFPLRGLGLGEIWGPHCLFMSPLLQCVTGDPPGNGDEPQPV